MSGRLLYKNTCGFWPWIAFAPVTVVLAMLVVRAKNCLDLLHYSFTCSTSCSRICISFRRIYSFFLSFFAKNVNEGPGFFLALKKHNSPISTSLGPSTAHIYGVERMAILQVSLCSKHRNQRYGPSVEDA